MAVGAVAWLVLLVVSAVALRGGAEGVLAAPPIGSAGELTAWFDDRSPQAAAMALVRLLGECAVWYLLARSAVHLVGAAVRRETYVRALETTAPVLVRRLLDLGVGAGIVATTCSPTLDFAGAEVPVAEVVPSGTATMRPVTEPAPTTATARPVGSTPRPSPPSAVPPDVTGATVDVSPGDSFWRLAEETLASAWGRAPGDAEIDPYWRDLVELNRHRLLEPGNPDHLVPGQVLELPEVPPPRA